MGNKDARKLLITNNLISSLDEIAVADPVAAMRAILSAKKPEESKTQMTRGKLPRIEELKK